ncbi:MAG: hypothetical protein K6U80_04025 [Firmicutes bacterium]|nr:hypothetical protein [Bacillota bacterium]
MPKQKKKIERLYLGKICLGREEDQQLVIIDWRAPVAKTTSPCTGSPT